MKETRRALWVSGFSLMVSLALLLGNTYAWFTDNIANQGNHIVSGSLAVDLLMSEDGTTYTSIANKNESIFNEQNGTDWEPNTTEIVYLAVRNNGSLPVKYSLTLNFKGELSEFLEYAVIPDVKKENMKEVRTWEDVQKTENVQVGNAEEGVKVFEDGKELVDENETSYFAMVVHMREDAVRYEEKQVQMDLIVDATQLENK